MTLHGETSSIALWTTGKKKAVFTQALAHGLHETHSSTEGIVRTPRWITSLACLRYGDLLASGSYSSDIRLWKICGVALNPSSDKGKLSLNLVGVLPSPGIVNSLQILSISESVVDRWTWIVRKTTAKGDHKQGPLTNGSGPSDDNNEQRQSRKKGGEAIVVVAGLGREPKLGRWMTLKGEGATNGSRTFVLRRKVS